LFIHELRACPATLIIVYTSYPVYFFLEQRGEMTTRKTLLLFLVAILLAVAANPVSAHAILVRSTPKANEVVPSGDLNMKLEFNSRIDGARSILKLVLPGGEIQKLQLSPQPSPAALAATAAHLTPGKYTILWQVLSNDGHITRGEIPFEVK
jgi:copper resistance protein C